MVLTYVVQDMHSPLYISLQQSVMQSVYFLSFVNVGHFYHGLCRA